MHTAIWTGAQMIVWGGNDSTGPPVPYASTGGRYDPSADTWLATNTAGAPTGRTFHTAVWTGSEMLVWGGALSNPAGPTATGSRYNPSTDSWSAITLFNAPSARSGHAAVWTGSLMLIWGGTYNGARYRPATNTWDGLMANDGLPVHGGGLTVWNGVEMISWSGNNVDGSGQPNTGARYNPSTNAWRLMSTVGAPFGRTEAKGAWSSTAMIMWGGGNPTATGGLYCACHVPGTFYQDFDGDGFGSPSQTFTLCAGSPTPGFVANAADCNDFNASVHPGAAEICGDGLDNDCNGLTDDPQVPTVIPAVVVNRSGVDAVVSWTLSPNAPFYDVQRGLLSTLRATGGDFTAATESCSANNLAGTSISDSTPAPTGDGFWYLSRGASCGGAGSYNDGSPSQSGGRDLEIAVSPAACP